MRQQRIHQPIIKVESRLIDGPSTLGQDARPRNRKTIGTDVHARHQCHILGHAVIVVGSHRPRFAVIHFAWRGGKLIPDGRSSPVFGHCSFNLVGRGSSTPEKVARERCGQGQIKRHSWALWDSHERSSSEMMINDVCLLAKDRTFPTCQATPPGKSAHER